MTQASYKLAEVLYGQNQQGAGQPGAQSGAASDAGSSNKTTAQEDVVDADYEEVDDKKQSWGF